MATYPTNPPGNTLQAIQTKVRRLTRSPSEAQISTDTLNDYINTFVMYDFPEHLRTFNLRTQFTFTCNPFQDVYPIDIASFGGASGANLNPLYNFQNKYLTIHEPLYIAGFQSFYTQSPEQFFGIYPQVNNIASINSVGDGITTNFSGVIQIPLGQPVLLNAGLTNQQVSTLVKSEVLFSSIDVDGNGLAMVDVPALDAVTGNPTIWGSLVPMTATLPAPVLLSTYNLIPPTGMDPTNFINYVTGQFSVTFPIAPAALAPIDSQTLPQTVARPQAMLFYDGAFTLRPVPDQPYRINFEVYQRPSQLLQTTSVPELEEYWQFIAYGSAKKVFEDRMDLDSVQLIMPEYMKQLNLCNRRNLVQYTNERTATIYTEQTSFGGGSGFWGWGGSNF